MQLVSDKLFQEVTRQPFNLLNMLVSRTREEFHRAPGRRPRRMQPRMGRFI